MWGDLTVEIIAPLAVALVLWLFGLPSRLWNKIAALISARRLAHRLRQGPFDADTIGRSVEYYVRPMCSTTDPSCEVEPALALITPRESLFRVLDRFLKQSAEKRKHLLLLADSGMGKTSFLLNYFSARRGSAGPKGTNIYLISLAQQDCDEIITAIPQEERRSVDLFLDALDEDQRAYGRARERVSELVKLCHQFKSLVITCRTQFFSSDDEIPVETGLFKVGPVPVNESKSYRFRRLYLSPFDDHQIDKYLRKRYPGFLNMARRREARGIVRKIPALSVRPMLLAHLPDIMRLRTAIQYPVDLYAAMVTAWLFRESSWVSPEMLRLFSEKLAIDLYFNRASRGGEAMLPVDIGALAKEWGVDLNLEHLTARSLLNRTSDGRYKFAHRSIMEFFVAEHLINNDVGGAVEITDQIAQFITQRLGCWEIDAGNLFAYSPVELEPIEPEIRLGFDTDSNLFSLTRITLSVVRMMLVSVSRLGPSFTNMTLADAIIQCNEVANRSEAGVPREVFLRFRPQVYGENIICSGTLWYEKAVLLVNLTLARRDLFLSLDVLNDEQLVAHEFFLHGKYSQNGLDDWELRRRVQLSTLETVGGSNIPNSLSMNPAVSFRQTGEEPVKISYFRAYLNGVGTLASFGILNDIPGDEPGPDIFSVLFGDKRDE